MALGNGANILETRLDAEEALKVRKISAKNTLKNIEDATNDKKMGVAPKRYLCLTLCQ